MRTLRILAMGVALLGIAAAPIPPDAQYESFTSDDKTIKDRKTLLEWERAVLRNSDHTVADFNCGSQAFQGLGGGGRLPTIKELHTIFDEEPHREYVVTPSPKYVAKHLDQSAFDAEFSPVDLSYWSQTPTGTPGKFWTLNFATGLMEEKSGTEKSHTRCVRGGG